jgi:hypothetical protein
MVKKKERATVAEEKGTVGVMKLAQLEKMQFGVEHRKRI